MRLWLEASSPTAVPSVKANKPVSHSTGIGGQALSFSSISCSIPWVKWPHHLGLASSGKFFLTCVSQGCNLMVSNGDVCWIGSFIDQYVAI